MSHNAEENKTILETLREKANRLPLSPGVYIMKDAAGKIIYIGKSKALKNRVSQYFSDTGRHNVKTARMVGCVRDFDFMMTKTEIEALSLENRLIKLHTPKFNIRLKDDKSYPYIKVTINEPYPRLLVVRRRSSDGARYFGPYSGTSVAYSIVNTINRAFKIATCKYVFPRDIGKKGPCLNMQIGLCRGICRGNVSSEEYKETFKEIVAFLSGSFSGVKRDLTEKMNYASENLMFEAAALYRDRIKGLEGLWEKQRVIADPTVEADVISLYTDDACSCICIYYIRSGAVIDSEKFVFGAEQIIDSGALSSFVCELYQKREFVPKTIITSFKLPPDEESSLCEYLSLRAGFKVHIKTPERGDMLALCRMAESTARQYALEYKVASEKGADVAIKLASMLGLEVVPEKIEAYDISNYGNECIVGGKVRFENGKPKKSAYRLYKMNSVDSQNDYGSMRETLARRLSHTDDEYPDLILLDGGKGHVMTIKKLFDELGCDIPVFGMVKDEYHKTRTLTNGEDEISIAKEQSVFMLIYKIQEEVHRYTFSSMQNSKRKSLRTSSLEKIPGIGPKKSKILLAKFGGIAGIKTASVEELAGVGGISRKDAENIAKHFDKNI